MIVESMVKNEYRDLIQLRRISNEVAPNQGVKNAAVLMVTDTNKKILSDAGLLTDEVKKAGPKTCFGTTGSALSCPRQLPEHH
jgi:hypothetical protein